MMGAPTRAVTLLTGSAPSKPGMRATRLHINARQAPVSIVAGIKTRWSLVWKMARHKCGTAKPINMMGPQYAVTIATRMPEQLMTRRRARFRFKPRLLA